MEWVDYIGSVNGDEADENAIDRYNEWADAIEDDSVTRLDMVECRLDPDVLNEFCFYPVDKWDRLIRWAKDFSSEEEMPFKEKMYRATLLNYKLDPSGIKDIEQEIINKIMQDLEQGIYSDEVQQIPMQTWWLGKNVQYAYNLAIEDWKDSSITMDDVSFKFNSILASIVVRNDKDIRENKPARTMGSFQKDTITNVLTDEYKSRRIVEISGM